MNKMFSNKIEEKDNNVNLYTLFSGVIIVAVFTIYNITKMSAFLYLGLTILLVELILFKSLQYFYLIIFLSSNVMSIKFVGKPNALLGYITILFCVLLVLKNGIVFKKNVLIKLLLGSVMFILPLLINGESVSFFIRVISFVFVLMIIYKTEIVDERSLFSSFIFGCTANVISAIIFGTISEKNIFSEPLSGINDDRNYFAISCAIAISFLVFMVSYSKKFSWFEVFNIIVLAFGGVLSNSRTFVILLTIITIWFAFCVFKNPVVGIFLIAIVLAYYIGKNTFLENFLGSFDNLMQRFNEDDAAGGNGRFESWSVYLNYLFSSTKNLLLGCGSSNKYIEKSGFGISVVEHNSIVQLLFTSGIVGSVGYLIVLSSFSDIVKYRNFSLSLNKILPLFITIFGYCTVNGAFSDRLIYALYIFVCSLNLPKDERNWHL